MYWNTADEIMASDPDLAILPVGSIEQHGPHLPVMTDWAIGAEIGKRVQALTQGFLLPALPISTCREQMGKKGSVWMEPPTFYRMMTDILLSLKTQGFKKVLIIQAHGGIFVMTPVVRDANAKYNPDFMVYNFDVMTVFSACKEEGILEDPGELHAGECETSQMLVIAPETVYMEHARDFIPDTPRGYLNYGPLLRFCPEGVWGTPTLATAEKGERVLKRAAEMAVEEMNKVIAFMESKEKLNYSYF